MGLAIVGGKETETGVYLKLRVNGEEVYKNVPFQNFFYVELSDYYDNSIDYLFRKFKYSTTKITDKFNKQFVKITLTNNFDRKNMLYTLSKLNITSYESDLTAYKRFLVVHDFDLDLSELKVAYLDIETDDRGEFLKDDRGNVIAIGPILSCAIGPQKGEKKDIKWFYNKNIDDPTGESEKQLLKEIFDELKKYDVMSAWNNLSFDAPYIKQRQEKHNMQNYFDWKFINLMDDYLLFKTYYNREYKSYSLDSVAEQLLGRNKVDFSSITNSNKKGKFVELFKKDLKLFQKYNETDVELMQLIEAKANLYPNKLVLSKLTQCPFSLTIYNSILNDYNYLRKAYRRNVICPSSPTFREKESRKLNKRPGGGYSFCYETGLNFNLETYDFKSFYPLTMLTFNISPELYVTSMQPPVDELNEIFNLKELELIGKVLKLKDKYYKNGKLYAQYNKEVEKLEKEYELKMFDLMFKFIDKYDAKEAKRVAKEKNYVVTPADLNKDTYGWSFHPHRFYLREMGLIPEIQEEVLTERDKIKYEIKRKIKEDINYLNSDKHKSDHYYQIAIKVLGNSLFGVLGAIHTRIYNYDVVDSITTSCRWIIKKSILFIKRKGYTVTAGDTDSVFLLTNYNTEEERQKNVEELDKLFKLYYIDLFKDFNTIYRRKIKHPETNEEIEVNFWELFEHEHTYKAIINTAKKRYYYLETETDKNGNKKQWIESRGGAFLKTDTNPLAAKLQKELCYDIMTKNYDKQKWHERLLDVKTRCFDNKLETKYLIFSKKYTRHHDEFGKVMIDSKTNEPKLDKKGNVRFSPVPVHIKLVKRKEKDNVKYEVGDTIEYIVKKPTEKEEIRTYKNGKTKKVIVKESSQEGITVEEYEKGELYDAELYHQRIMTPIIEILSSVYPEDCYTYFADCWFYSKKQLDKIMKKYLEELDE